MPLKDLSGKTVHDLEPEDFEKLFCRQCRYYRWACDRRLKDINACQLLIDSGTWDSLYRKRQGGGADMKCVKKDCECERRVQGECIYLPLKTNKGHKCPKERR
jgi:hypothetical protein